MNSEQWEELPEGWKWAQLPDVVYFQEGPGLLKKQFRENGIPFLNIRTFSKGRINRELCQYLDPNEVSSKYGHFLLNEGDIVVSSSGSLGKTAIIQKDDLPLMLNTSVIRFRSLDESMLSDQMLYFFLNSKVFMSQIDNLKTGTAQLNFGPTHLRQVVTPIPPLPEQRRLVAKIERLFAESRTVREALDHVPALLKRFRQAVLAKAFRGELTERDPNDEPASILLELVRAERRRKWEEGRGAKGKKYVEPEPPDTSDLPELPEEWCWTTVEVATGNFDGQRVPVKEPDRKQRRGKYPYYGASGVIDYVDDYLFDGMYLLIGEDGANLLSRSTPIAFQASGQFWVNNHAHVLQTFAGIPLAFLEHYFNKIDLSPNVTGTAQPKLTQKHMNRIAIPLPSLAEQHRIVAKIESLFAQAQAIEQAVAVAQQRAEKVDQAVLARAFRGEL